MNCRKKKHSLTHQELEKNANAFLSDDSDYEMRYIFAFLAKNLCAKYTEKRSFKKIYIV